MTTWITVLCTWMKLLAMTCRTTQKGWVVVEGSEKKKNWSTREGNGKPLQYSCLENPRNSIKRHKDMTLEDEPIRLIGVQYATGEEQWNSSRKEWRSWAKADMTSNFGCAWWWSKVCCCKEQYCVGIWNVRPMNQGKLEWSNTRCQEWTSVF